MVFLPTGGSLRAPQLSSSDGKAGTFLAQSGRNNGAVNMGPSLGFGLGPNELTTNPLFEHEEAKRLKHEEEKKRN